jgi:DNA-binding Lrp family transcriptional regulator
MVKLDPIDKQILHHFSQGTASYQELSRQCNVSRNTIYRRLKTLQEKGIIRSTTLAVINYQAINIKVIGITINVSQKLQDELVMRLKEYSRIKFLYKSFGVHNVVALAYCDEEQVGETISNIKMILESYGVAKYDIDVSFTCEKAEFTPFEHDALFEGPDITK